MYSFNRSLIGPNEARMLIHDRVVVRTTRTAARPSTPTLYWTPKTGIQSSLSTYEKPLAAGSSPMSISRDSTNETRATARAVQRMDR